MYALFFLQQEKLFFIKHKFKCIIKFEINLALF